MESSSRPLSLSSSPSDSGIQAYNSTYRFLIDSFGFPVSSNPAVGPNTLPGPTISDLEMTFNVAGRVLNVSLELIDKFGFQHPTAQFMARYNERSQISDFVAYNGHSDYGENIRALARLGSFVSNQYQIYFINGCDTFAYIDDELRAAHVKVNPSGTPYQFLDIITNSLPAFFSSMPLANGRLLQALMSGSSTYRAILSTIDPKQSAVVIGEEDNTD